MKPMGIVGWQSGHEAHRTPADRAVHGMNRRGFLGAILAAGAAPAIIRAESLMRVTGIIVPTTAEVVTYGNSLLSIEMITAEALRVLEKNLKFAHAVNRSYNDQFTRAAAEIGDRIKVRTPRRWTHIQ